MTDRELLDLAAPPHKFNSKRKGNEKRISIGNFYDGSSPCGLFLFFHNHDC